jgi:hypothetical protein
MREPDNHTVLFDRDGDTWVRFDEWPGMYGTWRHIATGDGWDRNTRDLVGQGRSWEQIQEHKPLIQPTDYRAAFAVAQVEGAHRRD